MKFAIAMKLHDAQFSLPPLGTLLSPVTCSENILLKVSDEHCNHA